MLQPASLSGDNGLTGAVMSANGQPQASFSLHLSPESYENISYHVSGQGYLQINVLTSPYSIIGSQKGTTYTVQNVTGNGAYSFHEGGTSQSVTVELNTHPSANGDLNATYFVTATSYYPNSLNLAFFVPGLASLCIFAIMAGVQLSRINRNPESYWLRLERRAGNGDGSGITKNVPLRNQPEKSSHFSTIYIFALGVVLFVTGASNFFGFSSANVAAVGMEAIGGLLLAYSGVIWFINRIISDDLEPLALRSKS